MIKFTLADLERAAEEWRANCGPAALAAICGLTLDEARQHFPAFRGWTNPTTMFEALRRTGCDNDVTDYTRAPRTQTAWPRYGLALIQFEGPWTADRGAAWARRVAPRFTHWIGVMQPDGATSVWDANALDDLSSTGWVTLDEWERLVAPGLVASYRAADKRVTDGWHITHAIEVERR